MSHLTNIDNNTVDELPDERRAITLNVSHQTNVDQKSHDMYLRGINKGQIVVSYDRIFNIHAT